MMAGVNVGTAYVTVLPSTRGFHAALAREVEGSAGAAGVVGGKSFSAGFAKAIPAIGGALAAAFSVQKVMQFAGESIAAASDLAESQSKVAVVFGQSSEAINKWAESAATDLLMSKQAALEAAGTYGNLFQAFGIGQSKAQEMSTTLVQLAADLASFNNTSVEDALLALRSGLSGETEPLKRFGIALTDTRLKAVALEQGIYDGTGTLDAAQKAQAAYALILQDTTLAQGDVARTSDGYANTMRAVGAAVEDAKAIIGEQLVESIQEVSKSLGGPDGAVAMIHNFATEIAGLIDMSTNAIGPLTDLAARLDELAPDWLPGGVGPSIDWTQIFGNLKPIVDVLVLVGKLVGVQEDAADAAIIAGQGYVRMGPPLGTVAEKTDLAAAAAEKYDAYLQSMTDNVVKSATGVDTLSEALDKFNRKNAVRGTGIAIRDQWRSLDTMGERVWRGKGKDRRQVQLPFDPTIRDGRFGLDESGDKARDWARRIAQAYMDRAELLGGQKGEDLLERGRQRLARQFAEWGVEDPTKYAKSFLRTPATLVTENNLRDEATAEANRTVTEESRRLGTTTIYQFNGNIEVRDSAAFQQAAKEARRLAALSDRGAGPVAPAGSL